ncbi:Nramp family divalent metal transporter [Streptomyces sp. NL15-2K]|uniref:Nramp family divalent metal transporter n=1 Tax=Streptomyces sp. NL15-2K TaxID=376149 RepID=UPI000FF984BA|nr:Nramp family divalent metal transporter [Streptomyces sp. NL15-2K]GCB52311.1 manganese transport protein mntH [Streptomyces sp. NL15-2K]
MVTSLAGAAGYGMALLWAILIGVVLKYALTEAVGRLYLASGPTVIASLRAAGRWLPYALFAFVAVIGLLYGAALGSVVALALSTLLPALPLRPPAMVIAPASAGLVYVGRYALFERVMSGFILSKFVGMVVLAVATLVTMDDPSALVSSLRPRLPEGDVVTVLSLIGGVGGTAGVASYSYWVREKRWRHRSWLPVMRAGSAVSYAVTFLFVARTPRPSTTWTNAAAVPPVRALLRGRLRGVDLRGTAGSPWCSPTPPSALVLPLLSGALLVLLPARPEAAVP